MWERDPNSLALAVGGGCEEDGWADIQNTTPRAQALRLRIDIWDLMKLKSFCKAKDTVNRTK